MSQTLGLKGAPELLDVLDRLPNNIVRNVLRGGLRAGAKVIADEARLYAPFESGALEAAIKVKTGTENGQPRAWVKLSGPHAFLGPMMEWGVLPHLISVRDEEKPTRKTRHGLKKLSMGTINKMVRRGSLKIGEHFVGPVVQHPGHASRPFMRPALDNKADEAINAMGQYIADRIQIGSLQAPAITVDED